MKINQESSRLVPDVSYKRLRLENLNHTVTGRDAKGDMMAGHTFEECDLGSILALHTGSVNSCLE